MREPPQLSGVGMLIDGTSEYYKADTMLLLQFWRVYIVMLYLHALPRMEEKAIQLLLLEWAVILWREKRQFPKL